MKKRGGKSGILLAAAFILSALSAPGGLAEVNAAASPPAPEAGSYGAYLEQHGQAAYGAGKAEILCAAFDTADGSETVAEMDGKGPVLLWRQGAGRAEYSVAVPSDGLYNIRFIYHTVEGKKRPVELSLKIDGQQPFDGCGRLELGRLYRDILEDGEIPRDTVGNDVQPEQEEVFRWDESLLQDSEGLYGEPYRFFLTEGRHRLTVDVTSEPVALYAIVLEPPKNVPVYKDAVKDWDTSAAPFGFYEGIQAEKPVLKSGEILHPVFDKSDAGNQPSSPYFIRLNTIGGSDWSRPGQWIEWEIEVPKDGLYNLGARFRQNQVRGFRTYRTMTIDGRLPFEECRALEFPYDGGWQSGRFGGETPYLFYLTEGVHTLRLEVTLGDMAGTVRELEAVLQKLNGLYRKILMITGVSPDINRDYDVDSQIPDLVSTLMEQAGALLRGAAAIEGKQSGSEAALLYRLAEQLQSFAKEPYTIPERLSKFRENLSSFAAWLLNIREQPLELDYLYVCAPDSETLSSAGFFRQLGYQAQCFWASFVMDYNSIGAAGEEQAVEVWMSVGREQANVLRRLIDQSFIRKTGIPVELRLVSGGLLQAVMAGQGPDVALNLGRTDPVNLALRGAAAELQDMAGAREVESWFTQTALHPYQIEGKWYALPETQLFDMMFYRTDILDELGLSPPETWDELLRIATVIQRGNMEIGLPANSNVFAALFLQNGGSYYDEGLTKLTVDSSKGQEAFRQWTDFYLQYSFPLYKEDYTRFRTGEMPLTITNYTFYNQLTFAAPEIRNLWKMAPIPGIRMENGEIRRTAITGGTACMMLSDARDRNTAWSFLRWWVSAETQAAYGNGIEAAMGPAARYTPASRDALEELAWSEQELRLLEAQRDQTVDLPELPGGYYVTRNMDNAFRARVFHKENARAAWTHWTDETNREIARKRKEFGLFG